MRECKQLAVHLGGLPNDATALAYTQAIAKVSQPSAVHVVIANDQEADPRSEPQLAPELAGVCQFQRTSGNGVREILTITREHDIDLVIVGRPLPSQHATHGTVFLRLTRKAPCSVLIVPRGATPHFSRVLVPVDFSDHSRMALEAGACLARETGNEHPQIIAMSVYSVGYGYSKTGVSFDEASGHMLSAAEKELTEFIADTDLEGMVCEKIVIEAPDIAEAVGAAASVRHMDVVCIGSRGVTPDTVALVGSTTERMVAQLAHPVLVVKRKGETAKFLDVLLGRA
jgi:nucleotide-binding universal stress UspA family protein